MAFTLSPPRQSMFGTRPPKSSRSFHAGLAQDSLCFVDGKKIQEEVRRQIAARNDHPLGQVGNFRRSSDQFVELWVTIRFRVDPERRAIDGTQKAVPDVERVVRPNPS